MHPQTLAYSNIAEVNAIGLFINSIQISPDINYFKPKFMTKKRAAPISFENTK